MKIVLIDSNARAVSSEDREVSVGSLTRLLGSKPAVTARLPNGDRLLTAKEPCVDNGFTIGRSRVVVGAGVVVGKRDAVGAYTPPKTNVDTLTKLVRWVAPDNMPRESEDGRTMVTAILVDPETRDIRQVSLRSDAGSLDGAVGGRCRFMMRVTTADAVFVKVGIGPRAAWRKDGLVFPGRSLIVGCSRYGTLVDVATDIASLRASVEFKSPDAPDWLPPSR
ncbi:hypothetical protein [Bradyrhizobium sp. CCBAU 53338]|uniref:hypothetical protein n=1 Tax=Bradyrhizobium sp. CCBAU 53338 TaxID=1325111 RepID=UPI00188DA69A|nr:hypothetical protein [Bradyrhizobium sp. CCBAU 53338]